ncbi:hypothetical protein, partial [Sinorhizobium meliloti]|uniref:hypothetical protein n=1 Tax=Rhizobium meliloti TaxID=382 RepID=UPI001AED007A
RNDRAHYGRRGKAQPLAKHLRLEQKCARRTLTLKVTGRLLPRRFRLDATDDFFVVDKAIEEVVPFLS